MSSIYKHIVFAVQLFILTGVCSVPSYAQDITSNLIGHWTLEENAGTTAADSGSLANNGSYVGADPSADSLKGNFGSGIDFSSGSGNRIDIPDNASYQNLTAFTLAAWVRPNAFFDYMGIIDIENVGTINFGFNSNAISFRAPAWSTQAGVWSIGGQTENTWYHVAVTYDYSDPVGTPPIIYVNGIDVGALSVSFNPSGSYSTPGSAPTHIGNANISGLSRNFHGILDDARIYDRVLSPADIQALFEAPLRNCEPQNQGTVIYNTNGNVMQYCDSSQWFAMGPTESVTGAGCTNPVSSAGDITYNTSTHQMQYCNSVEHVAMGPPGDGGAGCSSPIGSAGDLTFNTTLNMMQYCEGDEWIGISGAGDCRNIGELCSNGSVYVGLSPDGNTRMYTQPADNGLLPWGTNSIVTFVTTGITNTTTGEANTVALIALDSDAGTAGIQQHEAAQFCADFTGHSNSDWYLPAEDELDVLYNNRNAGVLAGTFTEIASPAAYYWASTEQAQDRARHTFFASGGTNQGVKDQNRNFRCVRKD